MPMSWLRFITGLLALATVTSGQYWSYNNQARVVTKNDVPLQTSVKPTNYHLKIYPNILEGYFIGDVLINITCEEATKIVTLHAHPELNISHVYMKNGKDEEISIENITRNDQHETISLLLDSELENNVIYAIHLLFNGSMNTEEDYQRHGYHQPIGGLFRGSYMVPDSTSKKWYVGTNMSPKSPRKVFPCFDEPSFKATYQISIAHSINMTALSVTPIESTDSALDDLVWDNFETTPPISTFSVNIFIGDFENQVLMNASSESDFTLSYHHRQLQFMDNVPRSDLHNVPRAFEYLQEYLGVKYPLTKLDMVGVPGTGYYLTSSSPGLILSHEYKLIDRYTDKIRDLVDQWFLHIITPEKWNDFNISDVMSHYLSTSVMENTGISTMTFNFRKEAIYDAFSFNVDHYGGFAPGQEYNIVKGSWFLQMLNYSLTEKTLRTALGNIISNHMYSTYTLDDFWAEITKSGHIDGTLPKTLTVERLADVWLNNDIKRFPVLTITRKYDNDTALVEQHVFTKKINESLTEEEKEMLWSIPITYLTPCRLKTSAVHPVAWIHDRELIIDNLPDVDSFIIVNPTDSGMFFVNYDERNWNLLAESLISSSSEHNIPSVSRRKLLQDALFLAAGGELSYRIALNMTTFLFKETDHSVWLPFLQQIIQLQSICYFTPVEDKLNIYIRELVGPLYVSMTQPDYETQSYDYIMFWYKARDVLQRVGYQPHIDEQNKYMKTQLPTFSYFDNDTQLTLYCPESLKNTSGDWFNYTSQLGQFIHYRDYSLKGICKCPGFIDLAKRILNGTLDEDTAFMSYEFNNLFHLLTACPQSYNMTVDFFVENFDELRHRFYFVKDMWNGMVDAVFSKVRTRSQMDRLTALYEEKKPKFGYSSSNVKREISEAKRLTEARESSLYEIELWFDRDWPAIKDAIM